MDDKREDYQNCSMLYVYYNVQKLRTYLFKIAVMGRGQKPSDGIAPSRQTAQTDTGQIIYRLLLLLFYYYYYYYCVSEHIGYTQQ